MSSASGVVSQAVPWKVELTAGVFDGGSIAILYSLCLSQIRTCSSATELAAVLAVIVAGLPVGPDAGIGMGQGAARRANFYVPLTDGPFDDGRGKDDQSDNQGDHDIIKRWAAHCLQLSTPSLPQGIQNCTVADSTPNTKPCAGKEGATGGPHGRVTVGAPTSGVPNRLKVEEESRGLGQDVGAAHN